MNSRWSISRQNSQPLSVEYSILVNQYALTDSGYNFLAMMQQNTQSLGSIFDILPSEITGNIHSLSNPTEPVIGYISASTLQQERIFISREQLPYWDWVYECGMPNKNTFPTIQSHYYFGELGYLPLYEASPPFGWLSATYPTASIAGFRADTTQKPAFWPN